MIRKILFSTAAIAATAAIAVLPAQSTLAKDQGRGLNGACATEFAFNSSGTVTVTGACRYGHLGRTTCVAEQTVIPNGDGTLAIDNTGVCTAANGDELWTSFSGTGVPTSPVDIVFSGIETYDGGTGRFAEATGAASLSGSAQFTSPSGGVGSFTLRGRIDY